MQPKSFSPVTHVIFDMDGLLLNTVPIYNEMMRSIVVQQGFVFTDSLRTSLLGRNRQDSADLIVRHCQNSLTVEECLVQLAQRHPQMLRHCQLMPGAERLIRHLHRHGVPMAIGTSSARKSVALKSTGHEELLSLIHHITCGMDDPNVQRGKPAPDIFLAAAKAFGNNQTSGLKSLENIINSDQLECSQMPSSAEPHRCLVFEDAWNGVQAGRAADMQVVYIPDRSDKDQDDMTKSGPAGAISTSPSEEHFWSAEACTDNTDSISPTIILDSLLDFQPELFGLPPFRE